jgi:hypothetical protein
VAFPLRSDGTGSIGSGRSTDAWWQTVMDMLMNSSETIVMDVAHVGNGSAWEIHALERWGFEELLPRALQPELLVYNEPSVHQSRHPDRFNGGNLGFRRQTDPAGTAKTPRAVEKTMSQPIGSWEGGDRPAGQQIGPVIGRS